MVPKATCPKNAKPKKVTKKTMKKCRRSGAAVATVRVRVPILGWKSMSFRMRSTIRSTLEGKALRVTEQNGKMGREKSE